MSYQHKVSLEATTQGQEEEEEFYQPEKEINPYFLSFNNQKLEDEYFTSNILFYKRTGYILCVIEIIMMIGDFAELFQENVFPQKKLVYLLLLITFPIIVFVLLHFKARWYNFTFSAYLTLYITMNGWYISDTDLFPKCDASQVSSDYISFGYKTTSLQNKIIPKGWKQLKLLYQYFNEITLSEIKIVSLHRTFLNNIGINGSNFFVKSALFTYGTGVLYVTQLIRNGYQLQVMIELILITFLFIFLNFNREYQLRRQFLKIKLIEQYNNVMNNQIPHCLFAAKFNSNEHRIELFKCNSRAQQEFNINNHDDFERFITNTYLTNPSATNEDMSRYHSTINVIDINEQSRPIAAGSNMKDMKSTWENSLKGQIRQLIEQKIAFENTKPIKSKEIEEGIRPRLNTPQQQQQKDKSAIYKLQLRMQEGVSSDNKFSVRLSIIKLHECYVIITVDSWKDSKKQTKLKENTNPIMNKLKQNQYDRNRRSTHQTQQLEQPQTHYSIFQQESGSPKERLHAPSMPNPIQQIPSTPFHLATQEDQAHLLTPVLTVGSNGQKPTLNFLTEEDQIKQLNSQQQSAANTHRQLKNNTAATTAFPLLQSPQNIPLNYTPRQSYLMNQQIRQPASSLPARTALASAVHNNQFYASPQLFPHNNIKNIYGNKRHQSSISQKKYAPQKSLSSQTNQQNQDKTLNIQSVAEYPLKHRDTIQSAAPPAGINCSTFVRENQSTGSYCGSFIPSSGRRQEYSKEQILQSCFETIGQTMEIIKRFKKHSQGFKNQSKKYSFDALSKSNSPIDQYISSIIQQIFVFNSNFMKFQMFQMTNKPFSFSSFSIKSLIVHLKSHLSPLLIDRNIHFLVQEDYDAQFNSDQNSICLVLINLIFYISGNIQDSSFVALKFSVIENNNLRVQLTMPSWEGHPFNNLQMLNQLSHIDSVGQQTTMSQNLMIDLRVSFILLRKLNLGNQSLNEYTKFQENVLKTSNICFSFTIPCSEQNEQKIGISDLNCQSSEKIKSKDQKIILNPNEPNNENDDCFLDDSLISLDRWISYEQFTLRNSTKQTKFMQ